jgi:hypothetical protein
MRERADWLDLRDPVFYQRDPHDVFARAVRRLDLAFDLR